MLSASTIREFSDGEGDRTPVQAGASTAISTRTRSRASEMRRAAAALLLGLVMALFGERTTNRRLEDIERG